MRCVKKLMICVASLGLVSPLWAALDREAAKDRRDHAGYGISEILAAPVTGIPEKVLGRAKCIALAPHLFKGGFVFDAEWAAA